MKQSYKHAGKRLVMSIARELILKFFSGYSGVPRSEIIEKIKTEHLNGGGTLHTKEVHPVADALQSLKNKGLADNPIIGFWDID